MAPTTKNHNSRVFAGNDKHGVKYSVLKCPTVFTQTLNDLCSDMEKICLYKYFVLHEMTLLSFYWEQATMDNINEFNSVDNTWIEGAFAKIIKTYKNKVFSGENTVAAGDVFCAVL